MTCFEKGEERERKCGFNKQTVRGSAWAWIRRHGLQWGVSLCLLSYRMAPHRFALAYQLWLRLLVYFCQVARILLASISCVLHINNNSFGARKYTVEAPEGFIKYACKCKNCEIKCYLHHTAVVFRLSELLVTSKIWKQLWKSAATKDQQPRLQHREEFQAQVWATRDEGPDCHAIACHERNQFTIKYGANMLGRLAITMRIPSFPQISSRTGSTD